MIINATSSLRQNCMFYDTKSSHNSFQNLIEKALDIPSYKSTTLIYLLIGIMVYIIYRVRFLLIFVFVFGSVYLKTAIFCYFSNPPAKSHESEK